MCLGMIRIFVVDFVHHHIATETTAYGIWITLKETYKNSSPINKVLALGRSMYFKYTDDSLMLVHYNRIKGIINLLNNMNTSLTDELHTLLDLVCLPDSWVPILSSLRNSTTKNKLTVKSVTTALLKEEVKRKNTSMKEYEYDILHRGNCC